MEPAEQPIQSYPGSISESTQADAVVDPLVGTLLEDRYFIRELLGEGNWSRVYLADQISLHKEVAVKILHEHLSLNAEKVERFRHEAAILSKLVHPNICAIHDFGQTADKLPFFVMDRLDGTTLSDLLKIKGSLTPAEGLTIFIQVCRALETAHKHGIIHRDVKPGNIVINVGESDVCAVKLIDFGLAKLTQKDEKSERDLTRTGETLGTPLYMSPEQCMGLQLDGRSDIYSLGCVMYQVFTGATAITGTNSFECMTNHIQTMPSPFAKVNPKLQVPKELEAVVFRTLQKGPDERYQSVSELLEDLSRFTTENTTVKFDGLKPLHAKKNALRKRIKKFQIAAAVALLVVAVGSAVLISNASICSFVARGLFGDSIAAADLQVRLGEINGVFGNRDGLKQQVIAALQTLLDAFFQAGRSRQMATAEAIVTRYQSIEEKYHVSRADVSEMYNGVGDVYVADSKPIDAERMYVKAWQTGRHPQSFQEQAQIAMSLALSGRKEHEAHGGLLQWERQYLRSSAIYDTLDGQPGNLSGSERDHAHMLTELGWIYQGNSGRTTDSVNTLKHALKIYQDLIKTNYGGEANTLRSIGDIYVLAGQPDDALPWIKQAVVVANKAPDKKQYGYALCALAGLEQKKKNWSRAEALFQQGIGACVSSSWPSFWTAGMEFPRWANLYTEQKQWDKAEAVYKKGIDYFESHQRERDINILPIIDGYGQMLEAAGRLPEAKVQRDRAADIRRAPQPEVSNPPSGLE